MLPSSPPSASTASCRTSSQTAHAKSACAWHSARSGRVVQLVVWQGLQPALLGVVIGLGGALAAVRLMKSLLYGVAPHDAVTYVGVTALLITIVLIACAIPAYRASRIAPGVALRAD